MPQPLVASRAQASAVLLSIALAFVSNDAAAGVVFNLSGNTLAGGSRWDAAPRDVTVNGSPAERSLNGGLRYSVQGGSYQAYRNLFSWQGAAPSVAQFQTAVEQAFSAWTVPDPLTQLTTQISFAPDFSTTVVGRPGGGVDIAGAEIDLLASNDARFWNPGNTGTQGETWFSAVSGPLQLTSGTTGYSGSAISGVDITMNDNPGALYTLDLFRRILTHEIGHALGLGDIEGNINSGSFIDDNFNGSSSASALATLTNSWAELVNADNPALSPLSRFTVPLGDPGTITPGVNILMESYGVGISPGNPVTNLTPLTNDDYGTRQFLYPSKIRVPEPSTWLLALIGLSFMVAVGRKRQLRRSLAR